MFLSIGFTKLKRKQGKNVVVFYGSQTGTAEDFANRLAKEAVRYGMKGMAADPEECDMVRHISLPRQLIADLPIAGGTVELVEH